MKNVLSDIDAPLRKSIVMLNLLGYKTSFSCCGFDYLNQPKDKSHSLGYAYIWITNLNEYYNLLHFKNMLDLDIKTGAYFIRYGENIAWNLRSVNFDPETKKLYKNWHDGILSIACTWPKISYEQMNGVERWKNPKSKHFHEHVNTAILMLEDRLLRYVDKMQAEATIYPTDNEMKKIMRYWAIEDMKPCIVTKKKLLDGEYD